MKPLRPYQTRAIELVRAELLRGHKRVVLVMPTGAGKTRTCGEMVRAAVAKARRAVWIAHRTELVGQAMGALVELGLDVGAVHPDFPYRPKQPVQVCSVQSLIARGVRPPAQLIIWDEAHHCADAAEEWVRVLEAYPDAAVIGPTATPERGDGSGLGPGFTALVAPITVRELTDSGHLVACQIHRPDTWLKQRRQAGNPLAEDPVDAYERLADGRQAILFASSVEQAQKYAEGLSARGHVARCVHAKTPGDVRAAIVDGFRFGHVRVLTNVYVFTEGTDLPMAEVCVLARGAGTAGAFLQMVGRVLRPHPGKTSALLIDLQGISHVWGAPEDERVYSLAGRGISAAKDAVICRVCGAVIVAYPCPECEHKSTKQGGGVEDEILNERMAEFKRLMQSGPEQRREVLLRKLAECAHKSRHPGFIWHWFVSAFDVELEKREYIRALADLTHDANPTVSRWASEQCARIRAKRRSAA